MGSIGNFADEFWNKEIGDFTGWDVVQGRIKEGSKVTHSYIELLKQVTSAMETFGKSLLKAAKNSSLPEMEHGKLKNSLQTARVSVEAWGQDTIDAATALMGQVNAMTQHLTQAKDTRKRTDDEIKVHHHQLHDATKRVKHAKRTAQSKMKEKVDSENLKFAVEAKVDSKQKELEKAIQTEKKAEDAVLDAEERHREVIFKHNGIMEEWRNASKKSLGVLQDIEEARVKVIRDSLWSVTNICSLLAVHCDQHQETIRMALLGVDVGEELRSWIALNRTMQEPPVPLIYRAIQRPSGLTQELETPMSTPSCSVRSTVTEVDESSTSRSRSGTTTPEPLHNATALYHFAARSNSEVSLRLGENVSVLDNSNEEWAYVKNRRGGVGFVPSTFLKAQRH